MQGQYSKRDILYNLDNTKKEMNYEKIPFIEFL